MDLKVIFYILLLFWLDNKLIDFALLHKHFASDINVLGLHIFLSLKKESVRCSQVLLASPLIFCILSD